MSLSAVLQFHRYLFSPEKPPTFFCTSLSLLFISLGVTLLQSVTPHYFPPVRPRLTTILCKFTHKKIFVRVSLPEGCQPGRSAHPLVTPLGLTIHAKMIGGARVRRRSRRTFSTHFEIYRRRVDGVVIYFFDSDFKFFDDASEFSVTSLYLVAQKCHRFLYALTLSNINRFSKWFYCKNQEKICNNTITKDHTTSQVCRYNTLWNVKCLKSNSWKRDDFCNNTFHMLIN